MHLFTSVVMVLTTQHSQNSTTNKLDIFILLVVAATMNPHIDSGIYLTCLQHSQNNAN
jgi:hypothetical protein